MRHRAIGSTFGATLCLLAALPAWAQSPFQSAPGPAPVTAPPKPAPHPRQYQQQQQEDELPPTVTTVPPVTPAPPPPPPPTPSLAGVWHFQSSCPLDPGTDLTVTQSAPEQYLISGSGGIIPIAVNGWVSGKMVHLEADPPLNHIVWQGTVISPTAMSGKITQTFMGINCDWVSQKK